MQTPRLPGRTPCLAEGRRGDDANLATRQYRLQNIRGVRRGTHRGAGADHGVRLVDKENQVGVLSQFANHVLKTLLEHPAEHRARDQGVHLQTDDAAFTQAAGNGLGLELDAARQTFGNRRLAHARFADEHDGVRPFKMAQDLHDLLNLELAAEERRQPIEACQQIQTGAEMP